MTRNPIQEMNAKAKALMVVAAVGLVISAAAYSQMQPWGRRAGGFARLQGRTICEAAAKLPLTEHKQRQIGWIVETAQADQDEQRVRGGLSREATEQAMEQVRELLHPEEYSQLEEQLDQPARAETVRRYFSELRLLGLNVRQEAEIDKVVEEATERIKRVLTPEQREQLSAALERPVRSLPTEINRMRQGWESFSDEERQELTRVGEEFRDRLRNAQTPEERRQVMEEVRDKWREVFGPRDDAEPE